MNTKMLLLLRMIFNLLPATKLYNFKNWLLRLSGVKIAKGVRMVSNVKIYGDGNLEIGENTWIGHNAFIFSSKGATVRIGENVDIAPLVYIGTGSHKITPEAKRIAGEGINEDIEIMNGVWIGARATILPGVIIGKKSIIAAGSVVTKSIDEYVIAGGVPCEPIKKYNQLIKKWEKII